MRRNAFSILPLIMVLGVFAIAQTAQSSTITWTDTGAMVYDNTAPDPTSISSSQFMIKNGGSLTVNSGTLTCTDNRWGTFIGQTNAATHDPGMLVMNGGSLTFNAVGTDEQRFGIGNGQNTTNPGNGILDMNAGYLFLHTGVGTDTQRGFLVGRDGGDGVVNISGGIFTSDTDRFGMGGAYSNLTTWVPSAAASGTINFESGNGTFILNGLLDFTPLSWNINTATTPSSGINWVTGSLGILSVGSGTAPAPQSFFDGMVTAGQIKINGLAATPSQFAYSVQGTQGTYQLVPEPSALILLVMGGLAMLVVRRRTSK